MISESEEKNVNHRSFQPSYIRRKGDEMEIEIANTIKAVNESEWRTLVDTDLIERSYRWYRTVEDSGMMKMRYVFLREKGDLVAAACSYVFNEKLYKIEMPFLQVGTPMGGSIAFYSTHAHYAQQLIDGLEEIQKEEKTKGILILELRKNEYNKINNQIKGFTGFQLPENTYIDLNFKDFNDYLTSLHEDAWRSVKMTLNRARRWKIKTVFTNEFSQWKDTLYRLQRDTCEQHEDYQWHLTQKFYEALENHLKEEAELVIFFKDDIPLAFGLGLNSPSTAQYKFAGVDSRYRKYQAYFLIYYEGIRKAIERKQKRIYLGSTTYEFKEKIGCKREPLFGYGKMKNPLLNLAFKSYVALYRFYRNR